MGLELVEGKRLAETQNMPAFHRQVSLAAISIDHAAMELAARVVTVPRGRRPE